TVGEKPFERPVQQALSVEPVVIKNKPKNSGGLRHLDLPADWLVAVERAKPQITGYPRLIMAFKPRNAAGDVGPLGEAFAPPAVVFRKRVKLGKVVRQNLGAPRASTYRREIFKKLTRRGVLPDLAMHGLRAIADLVAAVLS